MQAGNKRNSGHGHSKKDHPDVLSWKVGAKNEEKRIAGNEKNASNDAHAAHGGAGRGKGR